MHNITIEALFDYYNTLMMTESRYGCDHRHSIAIAGPSESAHGNCQSLAEGNEQREFL